MVVPLMSYLKSSLLKFKIWLVLNKYKFSEVVCILGMFFFIPSYIIEKQETICKILFVNTKSGSLKIISSSPFCPFFLLWIMGKLPMEPLEPILPVSVPAANKNEKSSFLRKKD